MKTNHCLKFGAWGSSDLSLSWGRGTVNRKRTHQDLDMYFKEASFLSNKGGDSEISL